MSAGGQTSNMAQTKTEDQLPYWLINVPEAQRPLKCPDFLLNISDRDKAILSVPENEFHRLTWLEVQEIIRANRLDEFRRAPLDHRRYLSFMAYLKKEHGSVMDFIRQRRVKWMDIKPSKAAAFQDPFDYRILYNDWPYGIDKKIIHLIVWTKFVLEDDPETNDLTPTMRKEIDQFVDKTFGSRVPSHNIIWLKNWGSLKSIKAMEHFHIMLNDPAESFIKQITNGDVAVSAWLREESTPQNSALY